MCGRMIAGYDQILEDAPSTPLADWIPRELPDNVVSSWNLAPSQLVPVVFTSTKDDSKHFELAHWGIIPPWNKDGRPKFTFNARIEYVLDKPTFAPSVIAQRCALPVTGFYEWTGPEGRRVPHAIFGPEPILPLAGLYRFWKSPTDDWILTATVLTKSSTGVMQGLHDRMPVFLSDELIQDWLDPAIKGDQTLLDVLADHATLVSTRLREYPVRPLVGDGPELIRPLA